MSTMNVNATRDTGNCEPLDYQTILDKRVVAPEGGERRPRIVRGTKIDFSAQRVVALLASEEGQPRGQVPLESIESIGEEEIAVAGWAYLTPLDYARGLSVFGKWGVRAKVVTEWGRYRGRVVTFWFRRTDGNITRYEVSRGTLKDFFWTTRPQA